MGMPVIILLLYGNQSPWRCISRFIGSRGECIEQPHRETSFAVEGMVCYYLSVGPDVGKGVPSGKIESHLLVTASSADSSTTDSSQTIEVERTGCAASEYQRGAQTDERDSSTK